MNRRILHLRTSKYQKGQGLVEHLILWPSLVFLVLGTIQLSLLYRDKATFNHVVFQAARHGATHHASANEMQKQMVRGLVPLYLKRDPDVLSYARALVVAYADNQINPSSGRGVLNAPLRMEVISPNAQVFNAFARQMYELEDECRSPRRRRANDESRCREQRFNQIPNDNLNIRPTNTQSVSVGGQRVDMNLQDANLLKVRGHWCAPLTMPLMASAFYHTLFRIRMLWQQNFWTFFISRQQVRNHPLWRACMQKTARNLVEYRAGIRSRQYFIPISADAVVRMQSAVRQ